MDKKQNPCSPEACAIACAASDFEAENPLGRSPKNLKASEPQEPPVSDPEQESADDAPEAVGPGRKRRSLIFHILYALDAHNYEASIPAIIDIFNRGFEQQIEVGGEEQKTCEAIIASREEIDEFLRPLLANWRLERVGVCTRLILRIATWELLHTPTDPRVILNEAIELAKCFAERDAYRFVNGVLDEALKRLGKHPVETSEAPPAPSDDTSN
jgi:transcription antitermination factor NusB